MSLEFPGIIGYDPWQHHYGGGGGGWGGGNPLMGGSPAMREAEAAHDQRVQDAFDSSRLQSAVLRGDVATAAAIVRSNPDVGIAVGGGQRVYGEAAAQAINTQLQPPANADELAASRNDYNSATVLKQELFNRTTTNGAGAADGTAVSVAVNSADTQWEVVQRGLRQVAAQAGLPEAEQASFVAEWSARLQQTGETGLYNYAAGGQRQSSAAQFEQDRQAGTLRFEVTARDQPGMWADLQRRAAAYLDPETISVQASAPRLPQGQAGNQAQSREGFGSLVEGAVLGGFSGNDSYSSLAGQTAVGFIPVAGQVADARDIAAAVSDVAQGKEGGWVNLGAAAVGVIPGLDWVKGAARVGSKVAGEVAEEAAERVVRADVGQVRQVSTGGLRNELLLTDAQKTEAADYARSLGMPEERVFFTDNSLTSYGSTYDWLRVGTDVLPSSNVGLGTLTANSRISWRGAIAHEVVGHRAAALADRTQAIDALEEAQASIRAARFAPELTNTERYTLLRDSITRLHNDGIKVREVKDQLWITAP